MPKVPREIKADVPFKDLNAGDTKNALYNLLYELESGGTFATSGVYAEAPLPGLSLTGFGEIPLPLAERDACAILKKQAAINQGQYLFSLEISYDRVPKNCVRRLLDLCRDTTPPMGDRRRPDETRQRCLVEIREQSGRQGRWGARNEKRT